MVALRPLISLAVVAVVSSHAAHRHHHARRHVHRKPRMLNLRRHQTSEQGAAVEAHFAREPSTSDSGVKVQVLAPGDEHSPAHFGSVVKVHYTGTLADGHKFDS